MRKMVISNNGAFALIAPDHVDAVVLSAETPAVYDVPDDAAFIIFSATDHFFAKFGDDAALPDQNVLDGSASALNPTVWMLPSGKNRKIGLVAPTAVVVTIWCYR